MNSEVIRPLRSSGNSLSFLNEQAEMHHQVQWIHTKSVVAAVAVISFATLLMIPIPVLGLPLAFTIVLCGSIGVLGVTSAICVGLKINNEVIGCKLKLKIKYFNN